jgi:2-deoxy-D-gluconate 3-dehydrogenase
VNVADLLSLHGRAAVVTGASKGIGRGIVERLHEAGAEVHVVDLEPMPAGLDPATTQSWTQADVRDAATAERVCRQVAERHGRLDILVNNAGVYPFTRFLDEPGDVWQHTFSVNVDATVTYARAAAKVMIERGGGGAIVNMASVAAHHPVTGLAHYASSKAAVATLTRALAVELGEYGIRVNAVAPGGIQTPGYGEAVQSFAAIAPVQEGTPRRSRVLDRSGHPDDVAFAVLYLVSDMAAYVTGAELVVDGGQLLV